MNKLEIPEAVRAVFARVVDLGLPPGGLITTRERGFESGARVPARSIIRRRLRLAEAVVRQAWRVAEALPAGVEEVTLWSARRGAVTVTSAGLLRWHVPEIAARMVGGYDLPTPADVAGRLDAETFHELVAACKSGDIWTAVRGTCETRLAMREQQSGSNR